MYKYFLLYFSNKKSTLKIYTFIINIMHLALTLKKSLLTTKNNLYNTD